MIDVKIIYFYITTKMIIKETDAEIQYQVSIYLVPTEYMFSPWQFVPNKFFSKISTKSLD